jgi:biopolymer transport protein ExbD
MFRSAHLLAVGSIGTLLVMSWSDVLAASCSENISVTAQQTCVFRSEEMPCREAGTHVAAANVDKACSIIVAAAPEADYRTVGEAIQSLNHEGYIHIAFP